MKSHIHIPNTVEPRYNEDLGTMKITLLYQVSHYIRVKKKGNIKSWDQQNYLVRRGFCYIRPLYNEVPLYHRNCSPTRLGVRRRQKPIGQLHNPSLKLNESLNCWMFWEGSLSWISLNEQFLWFYEMAHSDFTAIFSFWTQATVCLFFHMCFLRRICIQIIWLIWLWWILVSVALKWCFFWCSL